MGQVSKQQVNLCFKYYLVYLNYFWREKVKKIYQRQWHIDSLICMQQSVSER